MPTTLSYYHRNRRRQSSYFLKKLGELALKQGVSATKKYIKDYTHDPRTKYKRKPANKPPRRAPLNRRAQYTKYGLPATYQSVSKPVRGNAHKPRGTMVKFRKKSGKVKNMRYKYNQGFRITQYVLNPNVSFIGSTGQIKTRDSCIVQGSKTNHYKLMVWNASPVVTPSKNKLGNQYLDPTVPWVFESKDDNSNLIPGYYDLRDINKDGTATPEHIGVADNRAIATVSGIPFSGNSEKYVIPNMVQKAVNVNLTVELFNSLEMPVEVFFKVVRRTKPSPPNLDLSDTTQAQLWEETTKTICNNHITDRELYQTVFLYRKKFSPSTFSKGVKKFQIKKLIKTMYNRTSSYMHTDLSNRSEIGESILPNLDQHQDSIANQLWCVLGVRSTDDNKVSIVQKNISLDSDIKNIKLANSREVIPVKDDENYFRIRGYVTSVFAARDIERNSTLHASTITDLHTRLSALETSTAAHTSTTGHHQHPDLTGTWNHSGGSAVLTVTASSTAGIDYDVVKVDGGVTTNLTWIDDGNHISMRNQSTGAQHNWMLNTAGTIITIQDGSQYTKQ